MNTIYNIAITAIAAAFTLSSCIKLDTAPMGGTITSVQKEKVVANNPDMASASVNSISSMFNQLYNGRPGYTRHNDYGFASLMLFMDSRGRDLVSPNIGYNWYQDCLTLVDDRITSEEVTQMFWNTMYNQIYSTNLVAGSIAEDTEDSLLKYYLAQALAVRAFDYFNLVQMYQFTYKGHEDAAGVPIILDTNAEKVATEGAPRSSVKEVYDQIKHDIDLAVTLLEGSDEKRPDNRFVSAAVAHGIRARINIVLQDWDAAAADAQAAIDSGEATPISIEEASKPGFKDMTEPDWLWGIFNAETDDIVETGICNFPSHMGSLNYGYASVGAWRSISKALYDAIPETDARKGWFLDADGFSVNLTEEQQEYVADAGCPAYTQVKFAPYKNELGTATNANDVPLMRVEEMYLILAEAQANGASGDAKSTLETFVKTYRDPSYSVNGDVKDAVELQRRIELWGEGLSYFDILRYNKGLDRRGAGFPEEFVFNIAADDPLLIYQIPNDEIQANPQINEADNNPAGGTPSPVPDTL